MPLPRQPYTTVARAAGAAAAALSFHNRIKAGTRHICVNMASVELLSPPVRQKIKNKET